MLVFVYTIPLLLFAIIAINLYHNDANLKSPNRAMTGLQNKSSKAQ
jgi:hypothetical protein